MDIVERFVKNDAGNSVFDTLLIPALNFAERDRLEGLLSSDEETAVIETTREVIDVLSTDATPPVTAVNGVVRVFGYPANGPGDELALRMLTQFMADLPVHLDVTTTKVLASELLDYVRAHDYAVVCIADLPPSSSTRTRYLVKKLRAALPDVRITVGRWAHASLADEGTQQLMDAGASHVAGSLLETRKYLAEAAHVGGVELPAPVVAA